MVLILGLGGYLLVFVVSFLEKAGQDRGEEMPNLAYTEGQYEDCVFWGKFSREGPRCLPLVCHCLDVGLVFRELCNLNAIRRSLECASKSSLTAQQLDRLAVLAMLHDVGKANLGFQLKVFQPKAIPGGHIRELAVFMDPYAVDSDLHEAFLEALQPELLTWFSDGQVAYSYLIAAFSHHGRPLRFQGEKSGTYYEAKNRWWHPQGKWDPMVAIKEIVDGARHVFVNAFKPGGEPLPDSPRFHHRFAGILMIADWLGSHEHWFPIESVCFETRLQYDRKAIPAMMQAVGLDVDTCRMILDARSDSDLDSFQNRFEFPPRPLQQAVDGLDPYDENTRLVIAESETGSGKTEAALNWFFKLFVAGKVDSLYFALPTRVAARELYSRVHNTISRWFPDEDNRPVTLLAVPGYVQVDGVESERMLPENEKANRWQDDLDGRFLERQWAAERPKRFLAATVAVGTIDQALLSAVQTSHAHLRSVFLDRSLLIVDEVHASDFYMTRLLESLLEHHLGIGGRAMLLSATLGADARNRYTNIINGSQCQDRRGNLAPDLATAIAEAYPAITLADGIPRSTAAVNTESKTVCFELLPYAFRLEAIVDIVDDALGAGARVLIILNTVGRANQLLRMLETNPSISHDCLFSVADVICPHHGRFAPVDRNLLDKSVSERLGKGSSPGPLLLVGTQTLEQSLDIDADLMITDLAPADVLLQRVGRLHRHSRSRPNGFESARCVVLVPEEGNLEEALDKRGYVSGAYKGIGYGSVYEDMRMLELTVQLLRDRKEVHIPLDNRLLVEMATHPERLHALQGDRWRRHGELMGGAKLARGIAASHAIAVYDQYFGEFIFNELGGKVAVRLGTDRLEIELDRPILGPFGQLIDRLTIPGHMSPKEPEETIIVRHERDGVAQLRCGDCDYQYSRYGLEVLEA